MDYNKLKQLILKTMKSIYYDDRTIRYDWMGYRITEENKPTYHHIVKSENLIKMGIDPMPTLENGAYLGKQSHEMLHVIEQIDHDLYVCWNDLFLMINRFGTFPVKDVWKAIFKLRRITEETLELHKQGKTYTK